MLVGARDGELSLGLAEVTADEFVDLLTSMHISSSKGKKQSFSGFKTERGLI